MILAIVVVIAIVGLGSAFIVKTVRAHVTPSELRGDWWPRFEREFREYASRRRHLR